MLQLTYSTPESRQVAKKNLKEAPQDGSEGGLMMTTKATGLVVSMTSAKVAKSYKAWKEAIGRAITLWGEEAVYYVDCSRFLRDGEENVYALPFWEWQNGERVHSGLQLIHICRELKTGKLFKCSDSPIFLW